LRRSRQDLELGEPAKRLFLSVYSRVVTFQALGRGSDEALEVRLEASSNRDECILRRIHNDRSLLYGGWKRPARKGVNQARFETSEGRRTARIRVQPGICAPVNHSSKKRPSPAIVIDAPTPLVRGASHFESNGALPFPRGPDLLGNLETNLGTARCWLGVGKEPGRRLGVFLHRTQAT
jgi:hypothetical protein